VARLDSRSAAGKPARLLLLGTSSCERVACRTQPKLARLRLLLSSVSPVHRETFFVCFFLLTSGAGFIPPQFVSRDKLPFPGPRMKEGAVTLLVKCD
jgi:hypothetical protein